VGIRRESLDKALDGSGRGTHQALVRRWLGLSRPCTTYEISRRPQRSALGLGQILQPGVAQVSTVLPPDGVHALDTAGVARGSCPDDGPDDRNDVASMEAASRAAEGRWWTLGGWGDAGTWLSRREKQRENGAAGDGAGAGAGACEATFPPPPTHPRVTLLPRPPCISKLLFPSSQQTVLLRKAIRAAVVNRYVVTTFCSGTEGALTWSPLKEEQAVLGGSV
jgi:hypothetical protein